MLRNIYFGEHPKLALNKKPLSAFYATQAICVRMGRGKRRVKATRLLHFFTKYSQKKVLRKCVILQHTHVNMLHLSFQ